VVPVLRIAELFLLVIAVIAAMMFVMLSKEYGVASTPILLVTILGTVGVFLIDKRIKRLTEPKPITIPADFHGPIRVFIGKQKLLWLTGMTVMFLAPVPFIYEEGEYGLAIGAGLFGLTSFLMLLRDLKKFDSPYLILDSQAITTHEYGRIPWGEVDNAYLSVIDNRGRKTYLLGLSVYDLSKYRQRMALFQGLERWMGTHPKHGDLRIALNMLSHEPHYIDAVVKHLRAMYSRSIGVTPKTGDLSIDRHLADIDKLMDSVKPGEDLAKHQAVASKLEKLTQDVKLELDGHAKKAKKQTVILSIVFLGLIVFVVLKIWAE
jgi:hypothetical protein